MIQFPDKLEGLHIHLVGAKGTGMTALAEILQKRGAILTGSDVADVFYTDRILHSLGIELFENFDKKNLPISTDIVTPRHIHAKETQSSRQPRIVVYPFSVILKYLEPFLCIVALQA